MADVRAHHGLRALRVPRLDPVEELRVLVPRGEQRVPVRLVAQPVEPGVHAQRADELGDPGVAGEVEEREVELEVGRDVGNEVAPPGGVLDLGRQRPEPRQVGGA